MIELLVVIAIIAILAGILLPTIRAIRRQARNTQCLHNTGQCAYAVQLYLEEYRDWCMPWIPDYGCYCTPRHGNRWHTSIHWLIQEYFGYEKETGKTEFWECPGDPRLLSLERLLQRQRPLHRHAPRLRLPLQQRRRGQRRDLQRAPAGAQPL